MCASGAAASRRSPLSLPGLRERSVRRRLTRAAYPLQHCPSERAAVIGMCKAPRQSRTGEWRRNCNSPIKAVSVTNAAKSGRYLLECATCSGVWCAHCVEAHGLAPGMTCPMCPTRAKEGKEQLLTAEVDRLRRQVLALTSECDRLKEDAAVSMPPPPAPAAGHHAVTERLMAELGELRASLEAERAENARLRAELAGREARAAAEAAVAWQRSMSGGSTASPASLAALRAAAAGAPSEGFDAKPPLAGGAPTGMPFDPMAFGGPFNPRSLSTGSQRTADARTLSARSDMSADGMLRQLGDVLSSADYGDSVRGGAAVGGDASMLDQAVESGWATGRKFGFAEPPGGGRGAGGDDGGEEGGEEPSELVDDIVSASGDVERRYTFEQGQLALVLTGRAHDAYVSRYRQLPITSAQLLYEHGALDVRWHAADQLQVFIPVEELHPGAFVLQIIYADATGGDDGQGNVYQRLDGLYATTSREVGAGAMLGTSPGSGYSSFGEMFEGRDRRI